MSDDISCSGRAILKRPSQVARGRWYKIQPHAYRIPGFPYKIPDIIRKEYNYSVVFWTVNYENLKPRNSTNPGFEGSGGWVVDAMFTKNATYLACYTRELSHSGDRSLHLLLNGSTATGADAWLMVWNSEIELSPYLPLYLDFSLYVSIVTDVTRSWDSIIMVRVKFVHCNGSTFWYGLACGDPEFLSHPCLTNRSRVRIRALRPLREAWCTYHINVTDEIIRCWGSHELLWELKVESIEVVLIVRGRSFSQAEVFIDDFGIWTNARKKDVWDKFSKVCLRVPDMLVLPTLEFEGLLIMGLKHLIELENRSLEDIARDVHEAGGLIALTPPYPHEVLRIARCFDCIELKRKEGYLAVWDMLIINDFHVTGLWTNRARSIDDWNVISNPDSMYTMIFSSNLSREDILLSIRKGHCWGGNSPYVISISLKVFDDHGSYLGMMGDTLFSVGRCRLTISLKYKVPIRKVVLLWVHKGVHTYSIWFPHSHVFDVEVEIATEGAFRLVVEDVYGRKIWTNPVWIYLISSWKTVLSQVWSIFKLIVIAQSVILMGLVILRYVRKRSVGSGMFHYVPDQYRDLRRISLRSMSYRETSLT